MFREISWTPLLDIIWLISTVLCRWLGWTLDMDGYLWNSFQLFKWTKLIPSDLIRWWNVENVFYGEYVQAEDIVNTASSSSFQLMLCLHNIFLVSRMQISR